jgi:hypothetical protein
LCLGEALKVRADSSLTRPWGHPWAGPPNQAEQRETKLCICIGRTGPVDEALPPAPDPISYCIPEVAHRRYEHPADA